jgi:hypothetical protein
MASSATDLPWLILLPKGGSYETGVQFAPNEKRPRGLLRAALNVPPKGGSYKFERRTSRLPPRASLLRFVVHDVLDRLLLATQTRDLDHRLGRLLLQHVLAVQGGHPLVFR